MKSLDELFNNNIPGDALDRHKRLAADLALGSIHGLWTGILEVQTAPWGTVSDTHISFVRNNSLKAYFERYWVPVSPNLVYEEYHDWSMLIGLPICLIGMGYLKQIPGGSYIPSISAYELLSKSEKKVFVSYAIKESSALALLLWSELKQLGYSPFIDVTGIHKGDDWYDVLKSKVVESDYFIVLIDKEALKSDFVAEELSWAIESKTPRIIPIILHDTSLQDLKEQPFDAIANKQLIKVEGTSSLDFHRLVEEVTSALALFQDP